MKKILFITSVILMAVFSSCGSLNTMEKAPATSMMPEVRMNIDLNDIEFLGETTITANSRTYFGFIHHIDKVNGVTFDRRQNTSVKLFGNTHINIPGDLKFAAEKALADFPNADFFSPGIYKEEIVNMFLGKTTQQTMVIKAYKYKK
ncbi:MAG: hypothetical protein ACTTKO_09705 [Candidatus Limimorpha sp.]